MPPLDLMLRLYRPGGTFANSNDPSGPTIALLMFIMIMLPGSDGDSIAIMPVDGSPREFIARPRTRAMRATINAKLAPLISWPAFKVMRAPR